MIDRSAASTETACAYCHLPIPGGRTPAAEPAYCCFGCRLAAEITGQTGPQAAVHWLLARLALAVFLSLNVITFTMALWSQDVYDSRAVGSGPLAASLADLFRYLCLVLSLPVLFLLGGPLLQSALLAPRRDRAAADLLILLGVVASYVYSVISTLRGAGHVYFEVGCTVLVMVTLGRWMEAQGRLKTTAALDALEKLLPDTVRVVQADGAEIWRPLHQIAVGDRLRVLAGERVASDGRLLAGSASIDQQLLTGESRPVTRHPPQSLLGGSLNLDGDLLIEVSAPPQSGSLARLIALVQQARHAKGRYQRLVDRIAGWFLMGVIAIACATFSLHAWLSGVDQGVLTALAVLLIACPCALGLATPMAVWTAMGRAARAGVLLRSGETLERLARVRAIRFDKTGTLTTPTPELTQLVFLDERQRHEILARAASLAAASTHVFSKAIATFLAEHEGTAPARPSQPISTAPGRSVFARFAAEPDSTYLGSVRWLMACGCLLDPARADEVEQLASSGNSLTAIGWGGRIRAVCAFCETLRPDAAAAVAACVAGGYDVAVLTGDAPLRGARLAAQLQVPVMAGLLPEEKLAEIHAARQRYGPVAMVGDGINDAPALAASDVGIALECGTDVSRESAGVCILGDDLRRVPWTIELARRTMRVVKQNLFWAFAYNALGIGLAAAGWLNPAWAAVAMVASSMLVISNSLRLGHDLDANATAGAAAHEHHPAQRQPALPAPHLAPLVRVP